LSVISISSNASAISVAANSICTPGSVRYERVNGMCWLLCIIAYTGGRYSESCANAHMLRLHSKTFAVNHVA
jgi:hypothetical protein